MWNYQISPARLPSRSLGKVRSDRFVCWEAAAGSGRADQAGLAEGALYQQQDDGRKATSISERRATALAAESGKRADCLDNPDNPCVVTDTHKCLRTDLLLVRKGELNFLNRPFWPIDRTAGRREIFQCRCRYPAGPLKPFGEHSRKR